MLLGTLSPSLLGNLLTGKRMTPKTPWIGVIRAGEATIGIGKDFKCYLILQLILKHKNFLKGT